MAAAVTASASYSLTFSLPNWKSLLKLPRRFISAMADGESMFSPRWAGAGRTPAAAYCLSKVNCGQRPSHTAYCGAVEYTPPAVHTGATLRWAKLPLGCDQSQLVTADIIFMPGVPFNPLPFCFVPGHRTLKLLPKVSIQDLPRS